MTAPVLYGAARRSFIQRLVNDPYASDWSERHERIAEWHYDDKGHRICGCVIEQAFCPDCSVDYREDDGL